MHPRHRLRFSGLKRVLQRTREPPDRPKCLLSRSQERTPFLARVRNTIVDIQQLPEALARKVSFPCHDHRHPPPTRRSWRGQAGRGGEVRRRAADPARASAEPGAMSRDLQACDCPPPPRIGLAPGYSRGAEATVRAPGKSTGLRDPTYARGWGFSFVGSHKLYRGAENLRFSAQPLADLDNLRGQPRRFNSSAASGRRANNLPGSRVRVL